MEYFNLDNFELETIENFVTHICIFLDFYFLFIIVLIVFMRIVIKNLEMQYFENLIKVIILGLILNIFLLYKTLNWFIVYNLNFSIVFWNNQFVYSPVIFYIKIFICILAICIFIAMLDYFYYEKFVSYEILILILLSLEGMFLMLVANDFFIMYCAIELQSMSLYILSCIKRYSNLSVEAGLKYFIYGSFASGMLLYGISLVYGSLGVTDFSNIYLLLYSMSQDASALPLSVVYGFLLILAGLFFKLGITPFHFWVADIYEGSPTIITYFFAVIPKISILFILCRAFTFVLNPKYAIITYSYFFILLFIICAILSIFFGSIGAIYQTKIKRLLAYSAIANLGFILLGFSTASVIGFMASFYYFFIYLFASIQIFYILTIVRRQVSFLKIKNVVELVAISHANFFLSFIFVFGLLSFAGIPPLAGFFGKFLVFLLWYEKVNIF